jgi:hypothetical protein
MANRHKSMSKRIREPYSQADFVRLLLEEFPELGGDIAEADGLLHLEMHAFTRLMQRAKSAGEWSVYKRGVHLATELWTRGDASLRGALDVSFLEHLDFDGPRGPEAWTRLTSELQHGWQAMRAYNERVAALIAPPKKKRRGQSR